MSLARRWLIMTVLSFSGGIIFLLPFLFEVFYRPLGDALNLTNTELGALFSVFGTVSMISYFPGGWLADRVSPRKLMTVSLLTTGLGGLYFATLPAYEIIVAIHAFWGVSITLLFWGAMIRITRNWGTPEQQGRAFGILETLRGIGEALTQSGLLILFVWLGSSKMALSSVIGVMSAIIIGLGVLSWFVIEDIAREDQDDQRQKKVGLHEILSVLKMPVVWLISAVVMSAYCAYWGTMQLTPYASDIFLLSVGAAGAISVGRMWLKPVTALIAGFISDRCGIAISVACLLAVLILSFTVFAVMPARPSMLYVMLVNVAIAGMAVFALRGIYFALLEEGGIPLAVTGTAGGIISAVGFTPDIFMPLFFGIVTDTYPGAEGYRYFHLSTAAICAAGVVASLLIYFRYVKTEKPLPLLIQ